MAVGIYQWAVHRRSSSAKKLSGRAERSAALARLNQQFSHKPERPDHHPFKVVGEIKSNMDKDAYVRAFNRIKHYLREGDCYQVNLAQPLCSQLRRRSMDGLQALRKLNAAPFSCYLNLPEVQILSSSPGAVFKTDRWRGRDQAD